MSIIDFFSDLQKIIILEIKNVWNIGINLHIGTQVGSDQSLGQTSSNGMSTDRWKPEDSQAIYQRQRELLRALFRRSGV